MPGGFGPGQPGGSGYGPAFGGQQGFQGQAGQFAGPEGCSSPEECVDFCAKPENRESCIATFRRGMPSPQRMEPQQGQGGMMPQQGMQPGNFPQGAPDRPNMGQPPCNSPEECKAYAEPRSTGGEQFRPRMPQGEHPRGDEGFRPQFIPQGGFISPREGERGGQFLVPNMPPRVDVQGQGGMPPSGRFMPPQGGTMEPPHEGIPGEFQRPPMTEGQSPMPQERFMPPQGEFVPQDNFMPSAGGFAPPPQGGVMPPAPEGSGGFTPPPMPMTAPMPPAGEGFAPSPMSAPLPTGQAGAPSGEMQASPPPPPPTSQLNPRSFIGLLYTALQGLIEK